MTDVVLAQIGLGLIGQTVLEQLAAQRGGWERDYGMRIVVRALVDSTGGVACDEAGGYSNDSLAAFLRHRKSGGRIATIPDDFGWTRRTASEALTLTQPFGPVIAIDTAAGSKTAELLGMNLTNGGGAVLSNKAPLALPSSDPVAALLWSESGFRGRLRYETTCGAGLPVISTLRSLIASGDEITRVVGALSGTLGAIFADLDAGKPFLASRGRCQSGRVYRARPARRPERARCRTQGAHPRPHHWHPGRARPNRSRKSRAGIAARRQRRRLPGRYRPGRC